MFNKIINTIDDMEENVLFDTDSINHQYIIHYDNYTIYFELDSTYHDDTVYETKFVHNRELIFSKIYDITEYCNLILKILTLQKYYERYGESEYKNINKIKVEAIK